MSVVSTRTPMQIRLADAGIRRLDEQAAAWGISRAELVRLILGSALADEMWLRKIEPKGKM